MPNRVVWTYISRDKFSNVAKSINTNVKKLNTNFKKTIVLTKKISSGFKKAGQAMAKFSAAASLAIVGSLKAFGDMEKGVTNVLTLLSDEEINKFGGAINKLATESLTNFGFSTEEATQALFNNVSALGANTSSLAAFKQAQILAIGGVTTLDTAVSGIAAVMNAYKLESKDATSVANAFFAAQKKGTTDVTKLATNIGQVAPIAKSAGVGFKELLATMAQLTQGGLSTEEATTSLKGVIVALLKPTTEAEKIFKALGVPFGATQLRAEGLNKTLGKLNIVSEKYPDLLAKAIPNIRALTGVSALQREELARIREIIASMNQDQLSPAFEKQMKTFNIAASQLKGTLTVAAIQLGEQFVPAFRFAADIIGKAAKVFGGFSDGTKKWIAIGTGVVAVMAPLLFSIAALITVVGPGLAIIASFGAALIGWPVAIGIAVAAVTGFLANAVWNNFDKIKEAFGTVKNFLGFGEDSDNLDVSGAADISSKSITDINLNINAPKGIVDKVKSKTTGNISGINLGLNMEHQS